jgi:hypothetical protein
VALEHVPGGPPVGAGAAVVAPRGPWMVLFALFGAALTTYHWASASPAKPLATFLADEARTIGFILFAFGLPSVLVWRSPLRDLRNFALPWAPLFLVGLVPPIASMIVGWEGGWILGIAGTAAGAAAGAAAGWVFARWTLPDIENRQRQLEARAKLPMVFAVIFALFGAYNWGVQWLTPDEARGMGVGWVLLALALLALPGALVGRPLLGLLVMSPFILVILVPLVASMAVAWEGGWLLGIAGAAAGAAAGAVNGWLFNRWIMPEYDKRRAREQHPHPDPPPSRGREGAADSTDRPGSSGSMAEQGAEPNPPAPFPEREGGGRPMEAPPPFLGEGAGGRG